MQTKDSHDQPLTPRRCGTLGGRSLLCVTGFTLFLAGAAAPAADGTSSVSPVTSQFLAVREQPLRQYKAYRRMHARSERMNQEAWLEAWTELDGQTFRYEIVSERGSEQVRNKVLKAVLKREQELIAAGDPARSALTEENYDFTETAPSGAREKYVALKPKRKDTLLVDGRMVLSPDGRELLRVEGKLAKNPSFWTSLVNVIRHYARLDGVRVPIATQSVAKVKVIGVSRMDMQYEYATINGRPVSSAARQVMASAATAGTARASAR